MVAVSDTKQASICSSRSLLSKGLLSIISRRLSSRSRVFISLSTWSRILKISGPSSVQIMPFSRSTSKPFTQSRSFSAEKTGLGFKIQPIEKCPWPLFSKRRKVSCSCKGKTMLDCLLYGADEHLDAPLSALHYKDNPTTQYWLVLV